MVADREVVTVAPHHTARGYNSLHRAPKAPAITTPVMWATVVLVWMNELIIANALHLKQRPRLIPLTTANVNVLLRPITNETAGQQGGIFRDNNPLNVGGNADDLGRTLPTYATHYGAFKKYEPAYNPPAALTTFPTTLDGAKATAEYFYTYSNLDNWRRQSGQLNGTSYGGDQGSAPYGGPARRVPFVGASQIIAAGGGRAHDTGPGGAFGPGPGPGGIYGPVGPGGSEKGSGNLGQAEALAYYAPKKHKAHTCNPNNGININPASNSFLSGVPVVGSVFASTNLFNGCQVKAIVGGLAIGFGGVLMLAGGLLLGVVALQKSPTVRTIAGFTGATRIANRMGGQARRARSTRGDADDRMYDEYQRRTRARAREAFKRSTVKTDDA